MKIAGKEIDKINIPVRHANAYLRDIISESEYPGACRLGFEEMSENEWIDAYLKDWEQYAPWIEKK